MAGLVPTETHPIDKSYIESNPVTNLSFTHFNMLSCDNVKRVVMKSATVNCTLDPIPTNLLKEHLEDVHTHTNRYHQQFPTKWKIPRHIEKCSSQTTPEESKPTTRR